MEVLKRANELSDINILHICGYDGLSNNLKLFKDFEAAAFNWDVDAEGVSLAEGKKFFDGKAVIGGFKQDQVIYAGTRKEVEKATFDILDECGQIGTIIGAGCTLPTDIEEIRLEWVRQASIKYSAGNLSYS
jgi:uroporphyrinogen decarboxylase